MNIKRSTWIIFSILAALSAALWYNLTYNQLAFINLSTNDVQAKQIASDYLLKKGADISDYHQATIFLVDKSADRYLQKSVGFEGLNKFIKEESFDMFYWMIRFFKEKEKEEYRIIVSSKTGEVLGFKHVIKNTTKASPLEKPQAKERATAFLKKNFQFNPDKYQIKGDLQTVRDARSDFAFTWQKNSVKIPWSTKTDGGTGKLVTKVTLNGDEILSFSKNAFDVPDDFTRHLQLKKETGTNLLTIVRILFYILFIASLYTMISRGNHLAMNLTKKTYVIIAGITFILLIVNKFNLLEITLYNYQTTADLQTYLWRSTINTAISAVFMSVVILIPGIAGELLNYQNKLTPKTGSFLYNIRTSFFTREVTSTIIMGYLCFCILLAVQGILFYFGKNYLGVWKDHSWITQLSSAKYPFISALKIGFIASFQEEIMFRLFALQWLFLIFGKITKNRMFRILLATIISSAIWGFAHSHYPVYPMWFRGIEVTFLGCFLSFAYFRFGIITVIVAHYLFDVFWSTAGYLFGEAQQQYLLTSIFVFIIPLIWAIIAYIRNNSTKITEMTWKLNKHQNFNAGILKSYLTQNSDLINNRQPEDLKNEIINHGWDSAVVDSVIDGLKGPQKPNNDS